jgi:hypothetical protein
VVSWLTAHKARGLGFHPGGISGRGNLKGSVNCRATDVGGAGSPFVLCDGVGGEYEALEDCSAVSEM